MPSSALLENAMFTTGMVSIFVVFTVLGGKNPWSPLLFVGGLILMGLGWEWMLDRRIARKKVEQGK